MEQFERDFKGIWIPKEIWLKPELSILDKIVFAEIDSLSNDDSCYASNEYLAKFCGCSERSVSGSIANLLKLGYIEKVSLDGRTRVLRSCLAYTSIETCKNCEPQSHGFLPNNIDNNKVYKKEKDITTLHSVISLEKKISKRFKKPTIEEIREYIKEQGYSVVPEAFFDYYESNGWHVGKNPMKDWKACVRTFQRNSEKYNYSNNKKNSNELALDREFIIG